MIGLKFLLKQMFFEVYTQHCYFTRLNIKKPYKCDSCDATFARKAHMRRHNESIHQGIRRKPLNCDNCEFVCYKKATMEAHKEQEKRFKIEKFVENGVLVVQISSKRPLKNSS